MAKRTRNQRKFVEVLAQTGDLAAANLAAYSSYIRKSLDENLAHGKKLLERPMVRELLISLWDAQGLTLADAARIHSEVANKSKKGSDKLRAIETVYKVHGALDGVEGAAKQGDTYNFLQLFIKQREDRGLTIPVEIIQARDAQGEK